MGKSDFSGFWVKMSLLREGHSISQMFTLKHLQSMFMSISKITFYLCDYDPFSFTKSILTDEEKKEVPPRHIVNIDIFIVMSKRFQLTESDVKESRKCIFLSSLNKKMIESSVIAAMLSH